jgi:hypothetical protein
MRFVYLLITALLAVLTVPSKQQTRYSYHLWGTVMDSDDRKMDNTFVCVIPAKRPINGRIPCVRTGSNGNFGITVNDTPDEYKVCASTKESPFILIPNNDPSHRVVCSETIVLPAHDEYRKVDLKFPQRNK